LRRRSEVLRFRAGGSRESSFEAWRPRQRKAFAMSETVQAGKRAANAPAGTVSPEEMLKQAVVGAKAAPAAAPVAPPARKTIRLGAN